LRFAPGPADVLLTEMPGFAKSSNPDRLMQFLAAKK
jgi:hypothetical protein